MLPLGHESEFPPVNVPNALKSVRESKQSSGDEKSEQEVQPPMQKKQSLIASVFGLFDFRSGSGSGANADDSNEVACKTQRLTQGA